MEGHHEVRLFPLTNSLGDILSFPSESIGIELPIGWKPFAVIGAYVVCRKFVREPNG